MDQTENKRLRGELLDAVNRDDLEAVKRLVQNTDVDINAETSLMSHRKKQIALHTAALYRRFEMVKFLLDSNADIHVKGGQFGGTPLVEAVIGGAPNCVQILLEHGANANDRFYRGSVLQEACRNGFTRIVELLLEYGVDVNVPGQIVGSQEYTSPLHAAAKWSDETVVQMLLDRATEVSIHSKNEKGEGPLRAAIQMVDVPKILLLLQYGAKLDIGSIHFAVTRRHEGTLRTLLDACTHSRALESGCDYEYSVRILSAALETITSPAIEYNTVGFTVDRVHSVWESGLSAHKLFRQGVNQIDNWHNLSSDGKSHYRRVLCHKLYEGVRKSPGSAFEELNKLTSDIPAPRFWTLSRIVVETARDDGAIINGACKLLSQLPMTPQPLSYRKLGAVFGAQDSLHKKFFIHAESDMEGSRWDDLKVTAFMSTLVIQTALYISCGGKVDYGKLLEFVGELLNEAFEMASVPEKKSGSNEDTWFIVKSFLWVTWQRMRLLLLSQRFHSQLENGLDHDNLASWGFAARGWQEFSFSSKVTESLSHDYPKPAYMCNWAYRLILTTDSPAITDLRGLVSRYDELWGDRLPRCYNSRPCSGDSPEACFRFAGATIVDQSAHDWTCGFERPCHRICWNKTSYRNVGASASVLIDSDVLHSSQAVYCKASDRTLAISHVWAHGQGGRPDTGINSCLHQRYCGVARNLGCDSYWIDTMCIPEDHELRHEAIMSINTIFQASKACLVCDRDVMEIDISGVRNGTLSRPAQIRLREMILATIIFCDWNVRAWTFLEEMQSRDKVLFLCMHNDTISLRETLEIVMSDGSVDIGIAFLSAPHLLPSLVIKQPTEDDKTLSEEDLPFFSEILNSGVMDEPEDNRKLEEAAYCLRYRPASRPGDAFIIWTILANIPTLSSPQDFWKSRQGTLLTTGFLMSGASRVQAKGLSWAPSEPISRKVPNMFSKGAEAESDDYPEVDMMVTDQGEITDMGFSASWDVLHLDLSTQEEAQHLAGDRALLRDLREAVRFHFQPSQSRLALLRPLLQSPKSHIRRLTSTANRSVLPFVAICEFCAEDGGWKWLGVRRMDSDRNLNGFTLEQILLV